MTNDWQITTIQHPHCNMHLCTTYLLGDRAWLHTFDNDDGVLPNSIIQAIQYFVGTLDLAEPLVQGAVLHIHHLACKHDLHCDI